VRSTTATVAGTQKPARRYGRPPYFLFGFAKSERDDMIWRSARTASQRHLFVPHGTNGLRRRTVAMASHPKTASTPRKKPYTKPSVEKYGSLRNLTTGGSGHANEPSSGKKPRP
jgi:hypothetical protein